MRSLIRAISAGGFVIQIMTGFLLLVFSLTAQAETEVSSSSVTPPAASSVEGCTDLSSDVALVECYLTRAPESKRSKIHESTARSAEDASSRWINPEIETSGLYGRADDGRYVEFEIGLSQTIELGGKREARVNRAKAASNIATAEHLQTQERVALQVMVGLYRLVHFQREIENAEEAIETFSKVNKQYAGRARLSPDQEVSVSVFKVAESENRIEKDSLIQERAEILTWFNSVPGVDILAALTALRAKGAFSGPDFIGPATLSEPSQIIENSRTLALGANLMLQEAELSASKGEAWPDLKIGPVIKNNLSPGGGFISYGFNLSLPLPLFTWGAGSDYKAITDRSKAEQDLLKGTQEENLEAKRLKELYESASRSLRGAPSLDALEKKHMGIERLFQRGIVPSSLIIEAHRQLRDYLKAYHGQELKAVKALWEYYARQGILFEKLKERKGTP